ncbi:hypothetical protein D3C75_1210410 [compost metagenome]
MRAKSVRKDTRDLSSFRFSNSMVTERNSSIFSRRAVDSRVFSRISSSLYSVSSRVFSVSSVTDKYSSIRWRLLTIS